MKTKNVLLCLLVLCLTMPQSSCSNRSERKEKRQEKIILKTNAKIEKLLSQRKFDEARVEASKLPIKDVSMYSRIGGDVKLEYQKKRTIEKINRAQMSYLFDSGSYLDALSLAKELDCTTEYLSLLHDNSMDLINNGQTNILLNILASWSFKSSFEKHVEIDDFEDDFWELPYNKEIDAYNAVVYSIFTYSLLNEDIMTMKKCIKLFKPRAEELSRTEHFSSTEYNFCLSDDIKKDAIRRAQESGLDLRD